MNSTITHREPPMPGGRPPSTDEEPRRRRAVVALAVIALLLLALAVGIPWFRSSDDGTAKKAGTGEDASSVTVTTTEVTLPILTPTDAALALYVAWQRGDTTDADRSATDRAAEAIAAIDTIDAAGLEFKGCAAPADGASLCTWDREDARLSMTVSAPAEGQPEVETVELEEL